MQGVTDDCWTWAAGDETTTDADGVFRYTPDNSDGEVEMRIARLGYSPFYNPRQSVGGDPLIIRLDRRTYIEGTVLDPRGKPAARVVVRGEQRDIDDLTFDLHPDMSTVTIFVERGVTFSGKVLDPNGTPVAGATVAPAKTGSGNSLTDDTRYSVKTKADGSFEIEGIRPGEHMIQVSPFWLHGDNAPPGTSVTVTLSEGETKDAARAKPSRPRS